MRISSSALAFCNDRVSFSTTGTASIPRPGALSQAGVASAFVVGWGILRFLVSRFQFGFWHEGHLRGFSLRGVHSFPHRRQVAIGFHPTAFPCWWWNSFALYNCGMGRSKQLVFRSCPFCRQVYSARAMRAHIPACRRKDAWKRAAKADQTAILVRRTGGHQVFTSTEQLRQWAEKYLKEPGA